MSNKGNYYKKKTKDFFIREGYQVEYLEKLQSIYNKNENKMIFVKRDLFGSDLIAINKRQIIFIQVKFGGEKTGINIKKAIQEFNKYSFPDFVDRMIVIWRPKQRAPEIIDLKEINGDVYGK